MEKTKEKRGGFRALFALCPAAHVGFLISAAVILLHLGTRGNYRLMNYLAVNAVRPAHGFLAGLFSAFPFSAAEFIIYAVAGWAVVYLILELVRLALHKDRLKRAYKLLLRLLSLGLGIYALFCLFWGVYYYGDDFMAASGLDSGEISTEQLETVTAYFAALSNRYAGQVQRDENGLYTTDRAAILARSPEVFEKIQEKFPCLAGPAVAAKSFMFSKLLSYTDFTGFFFPFTGEANVNMDFPPSLFASTVAHELSHQRGVAKEQEANFVAVMASLEYGDADYCYSACLLAYTHLGNALYSADREAWRAIYESLDENILKDFAANREYWAQFETPVQAVSNTVYEGFLQSYDQKLGMKSYGACVDLLVNYYYEEAAALN